MEVFCLSTSADIGAEPRISYLKKFNFYHNLKQISVVGPTSYPHYTLQNCQRIQYFWMIQKIFTLLIGGTSIIKRVLSNGHSRVTHCYGFVNRYLSVGVGDWSAECAIIASNVFRRMAGQHYFFMDSLNLNFHNI